MKQLFGTGRTICFLLFVCLCTRTISAQVVPTDSVRATSPQLSRREIGQLKDALSKNIRSVEALETLLSVTRELAYQPGQVVALCQLAGLRLQQQQPNEAIALMQEAEGVAGQIRDLKEARWAMSQIAGIQRTNIRLLPPVASSSFGSVMESLGRSMRASASMPGRLNSAETPAQVPMASAEKRGPDKRPLQDISADYLASLPIPTYDLTKNRHFRIKPDFVDRWIDTLIRSNTSSPQVVQQLTERKKRRDSSQELSNAFAKEGNYAKAYQYFRQYTAYKDSLTAEATTRRLALLTYRQNLLKKEAQIQLLTKDRQLREQESNRQRQFVLGLVGCIAVLGAFSIILTRNNRAKQLANRQLNEQKEALQETLVQLRTTQTQLIQSEKMASLGELTAGIAHEIQNPLNFVNNFSEVSTELVSELMEERRNPRPDLELENELLADLEQNLQKINQHGKRASSIVKGMLEHSRTSGGTKEFTDLNALAEEYAKLAYHGIRARDKSFDATLTIIPDPRLGKVQVVPQEIGRVLLNIVNNAFYAVHKRLMTSDEPGYQPTVLVQTSREGNQVIIRIRDNGTGVPEAVKQKIFQPFFTTKPTGQGTGLGLSLSYDIVTKGHGGTLVLDSKEGEFTELVVTLPTGA